MLFQGNHHAADRDSGEAVHIHQPAGDPIYVPAVGPAENHIAGLIRQGAKALLIRLLIGAEGGSLDKIAHAAGPEVTASAISQRRAQIDPAVLS